MFDAEVRAGVCRLGRPDTRWLSTGADGGVSVAPAAYNCTVPEGWARTDLDAYVADRLAEAGFDPEARGPALLTGVDQRHARRARLDPVEAVVTAGVSNPAALPVDREWTTVDGGGDDRDEGTTHAGTVNVVVGTTRALAPGALANLLTVAAEAKAATLLALTGVPGTTTDAVVAACDPAGEPARFSGSATDVGGAARACVRDALVASLESRYGDATVDAAADARAGAGVVTDERATTSPVTPDH
ncbi:adenosylcobinamide amidohydrolase [Haloplanus salilacus]|uniref:adenosylcobinamide amidohydrolase n=1 Tax=Haloplanus salilacus TaxID=2949994 RepID=UPI0030D47B7F